MFIISVKRWNMNFIYEKIFLNNQIIIVCYILYNNYKYNGFMGIIFN